MKKNNASLYFILITIVLDMIGIGIIIPTLPDIMKRYISDPSQASQYFGYFIALYALMQFLASPLLGALSDKRGRRPILLFSLLMASFDYMLMAYAPHLSILFLGRILSGLTGANMTVAMAYIADISDDKNRSSNFGMVGAAFGLGFIVGPALGGLIGTWGPQYPFVASAILNLVNFAYGFFVLPESLKPENRRSFNWSQLSPLASLQRILGRVEIRVLLLITFLLNLSGQTHPSIWTLYTKYRFSWTSAQVGASLAAVGFLSAAAQGGLTRLIIPRIGEIRTVLFGTIGACLSFFLFGAANQAWMMYAILLISAPSWISGPALQSLLSKSVAPNAQGELQGSIVSISSLAAILNPLITTQLFSFFTSADRSLKIPGAPYYFASFASGIGALIFLLYARKNKTSLSRRTTSS